MSFAAKNLFWLIIGAHGDEEEKKNVTFLKVSFIFSASCEIILRISFPKQTIQSLSGIRVPIVDTERRRLYSEDAVHGLLRFELFAY